MNNNEVVEEPYIVGEQLDTEMEKALLLMEQSDELTEQDIAQLLADDACMEHTKELWTMKKATDRMHANMPDIEKEWERAKPVASVRRYSIKPYIKYVMAAAALALLLFAFTWNKSQDAAKSESVEYMAYKANDAERYIVITSEHGHSVVVNKEKVSALGSEVMQPDELTIAYQQLNTNIVESHTVTIPEGKTFKVVLSDGSEVWLNAGSRLVYPTQFIGSSREVQLDGEAYFKVAPDAEHPFIVKAGDVFTRVLGTEFNIRMKGKETSENQSEGDLSYEITLVRGKVSVSSVNSAVRKDGPVVLTPGMQALIDSRSGSFDLREVDTDLYSYWKEGYFFFDNESLESIMKQIGSWYNVNVIFRNTASRHIKMHFFCGHDSSVAEIVEQLNMMQKVRAAVTKNTIYIE